MQDLESTKRPSKAAHYTGWEASSSALHAALDREQGIDGLLGAWPHPTDSHCATVMHRLGQHNNTTSALLVGCYVL